MAHDLVIRNGQIIDGSGRPGFAGDVAVDGDRISAVGRVAERGAREIDASGRLVTPGFVDIHTHLDAQLGWDPLATSSCWQGVTTVVIGNCGVTFAPVKRADHAWLAEMMESVEDIPAQSILDGIPWNWESYGEFLGWLGSTPLGVNVGGMVGHGAVRYYAMGERSLDPDAVPTAEELAQITASVDEAFAAGALGFSSSRTLRHTVPDGRHVPGTFAGREELLAVANVMRRHGRGIFEVAPRFDGANAHGAQLRPQTSPRCIGLLTGIARRTPFDLHAGWRALHELSLEERLAALRDPVRRAALVAEAKGDRAGLDAFYLLNGPDGRARYDSRPDDNLVAIADRRGVTPVGAFIDLALETEGRLLFSMPILNQDAAAVGAMLAEPVVMMGLGDAGAHCGLTMDASAPTYLLSYWARERGALTVEEAVRRITTDTAQTFGIAERGALCAGAFADLNVIDFAALGLPVPEYVHDFPHGAGRFRQGAFGYDATIVNGRIFMEHGRHTGEIAGRLLRGGC
ncbi:MAG: amidohydrolase family protein [Proteobacteria bacterium]|nr:amidohydrolase family protein [Pseudomonadota bacterium]